MFILKTSLMLINESLATRLVRSCVYKCDWNWKRFWLILIFFRLCFQWLMNILFPSTTFPSFFRVWLTAAWAQVPTVTQHSTHKVAPVKFCLNQDLFPQSLSSLLLCRIQMIQSVLHTCSLKWFCAVQPSRTVNFACESSSNSEVCNVCDITRCVASPVSRCCRCYNIACIVAEVQQLSAESGGFQDKAGSSQFGPRGTEACLSLVGSSSLLSVLQRQWLCVSALQASASSARPSGSICRIPA